MNSVSVIVCTHLVERFPLLCAALDSLHHQTRKPDRIVVVVDGDHALLERLRKRAGEERVLFTGGRTGLSNARNIGIAALGSDFVAFLDDDAVAEPRWLESLLAVAVGDRSVLGVGGRTVPAWEGDPPAWFPSELLWTVGCSHEGLPTEREAVRNVFGGCALFRRQLFDEVGGFDDRLGRKARGAGGCEETEFCIRAQTRPSGGVFIYEPAAVIHHRVHGDRRSPIYVLKRCREEGRSKAALRAITRDAAKARPAVGRSRRRPALGPELDYLLRVLPRGVSNGLRDAAHGRSDGLGRAALLLIGSAVTVLGFLGATFHGPVPIGPPVVLTDEIGDAAYPANDDRRPGNPANHVRGAAGLGSKRPGGHDLPYSRQIASRSTGSPGREKP
ncbi:MAG: glycosyltransferase family 2 protein [Frankia sp.]